MGVLDTMALLFPLNRDNAPLSGMDTAPVRGSKGIVAPIGPKQGIMLIELTLLGFTWILVSTWGTAHPGNSGLLLRYRPLHTPSRTGTLALCN